ncbi:hypothetical protein GW796_07205 [archaeon]|nr:hypothetical protein [archaeon]NCQ51670.1 hypothetical protein [archaeon]
MFENIKVDCLNVRASTNSFVFEFSPNKKSIIYSDHTISIGGFGCWNNETDEDTESRTKLKSNSFDESSIGDLINNLIIQDYEFSSYGLSFEDYEFIDYYYNNFITNYSFDKFIETSYTNDNEDHYGNHNVLRTMIIDIEQLADYIINFKYSKPFEELSKNLANLTEQNSCCSETYLVAGAFDTKKQADNFAIYMRTKFFRFLVSQLKLTQNITKTKFSFVPILDMNIQWTDDLLYKRYGIEDSEIKFIDSIVKNY